MHTKDVAVVFPSGVLRRPEGFAAERERTLAERGFRLHLLAPECPSENGFSAGTALERAVLFSHALTNRKYEWLWAARGGYGVSEVLPFLDNMLPPVLPPKTLVGFSDISLAGCFLASRYANFQYIHASHVYDPILLEGGPTQDFDLLFELLEGKAPAPRTFEGHGAHFPSTSVPPQKLIAGPIVPLNLSLSESLATLPGVVLPVGNILFVEDLREDVYRVLRKFDSLRLSGLLANTKAIVLGNFTACHGHDDKDAPLSSIASLVAQKLRLPVFEFPLFGHGNERLPLVYGAQAKFICESFQSDRRDSPAKYTLKLAFETARPALGVSTAPAGRYLPRHADGGMPRIHFTGIGGTGMAAVAGLFASAGHAITGSDTPIYPPMDKTIRGIGIEPLVNYTAENIAHAKPDAVVLANVISRRNAELKPNAEFERLLSDSLPLFSFPSALRHFFLHGARNVVVTGTHGKTTTTSLLAHLLTGLGQNPSFMVGGSPKNFGTGFALRAKDLFVLEGDEYDSALFDKGPKFLHYEPTVALLNNIEFDHADIYADVAAIEREFERLTALAMARGGYVVANAGDVRVRRIAAEVARPERTIWFGEAEHTGTLPEGALAWTLSNASTTRNGLAFDLVSPWGSRVTARTGLFGHHNALNSAGAAASLHALHLFTHGADAHGSFPLDAMVKAFGGFEGVKRRFELVGTKNDVFVFDDFAHHPTAIDTTLHAFKSYLASSGARGRLVACFDPRNATMRRRVLQEQLSRSFGHADAVYLGKVAIDKRLAHDEVLDGPSVASAIGPEARYFADNDLLCETLRTDLKPGDTIVFMSSGAFDDLPRKLLERL